jgi:hypothetical protein
MTAELLERRFERIRARIKYAAEPPTVRRIGPITAESPYFRIDVREDKRGEYFDIRASETVEITILDVQPRDRHLVLLAKVPTTFERRPALQRFLCGYDERHWFVAAIPESYRATTVSQAKAALLPTAVRESVAFHSLKRRLQLVRKNVAYRRQGEWFFIPCRDLNPDPKTILSHEPISGGGSPHMVASLYRRGGTTVYVCHQFPTGLTEGEHKSLLRSNREARYLSWVPMKRDPEVYASGRVTHRDHKTVVLPYWHLVMPNTEHLAAARQHVAFLD